MPTQTFQIAKGVSTTTVTVLNATFDGQVHGGTAVVAGSGGLNQTLSLSYTGRNGTSYGPSTTAPTNAGDYTASANFSGDDNHNGSSDSKDFSIAKATPLNGWSDPASIIVGTPLGAAQLNAAASVPGTFAYNPPSGTILQLGPDQTLNVTFTPADTANYLAASKSVRISVTEAPKPLVKLSASAYSVNEGQSSGVILITVQRAGDSAEAFSVDFATSDTSGMKPCQTNDNGIASERCDYVAVVGTIRFGAGESSKTIQIPIVNDAYQKPDETFSLTLSNSKNATLGSGTATITIQSDDTQTATANPIDEQGFFIRQQYIDFLGRTPDEAGFQFWVGQLIGETAPHKQDYRFMVGRFLQSDEYRFRFAR